MKQSSKWKIENSYTWKKYKVKLSDDLIKGVLALLPKRFTKRQVKFYLTILITELIDNMVKLDYESYWSLHNFGRFNVSIKPKIVYLFDKPQYYYAIKRVKFDFRMIFKKVFIKKMNIDNQNVLDWLEEKRRHRIALAMNNRK